MEKCTSTINDYKIIKKLGKGSYGTVYLVQRKSDGAKFAMKDLNTQQMDKKEIESTLNEIRILCSFNNEYICGYEEAFVETSKMHIIMEYVGGGDLSDKIE